jgi:endoglycosylceramidase
MAANKVKLGLLLLLALAGWGWVEAVQAQEVGRITQRGRQFVDAAGRVCFFRGVNDVRKSEPFFSSFDSAALERLATQWGFNVVRLGWSWEGYERARGEKDPAYVAATAAVIDQLARVGVYTIVDNHQDLMSRSHCGNGFPPWVVRIDEETQERMPFPMPVLGGPVYTPDPTTGWIRGEDCARTYWANYYFAAVTNAMYAALYADVDGIQAALVGMWRDVAAALAGRPGVLAYEVMNEPFPGSIYRDPLLLFNATYADTALLVPLYERVHAAIRSADNATLVFYEPCVSNTMILPRTTGLVLPGGAADPQGAVLSFHAYCIELGSDRDTCDAFLRGTFRQRAQDAERMGIVSMLTEFGHLRGTTYVRVPMLVPVFMYVPMQV